MYTCEARVLTRGEIDFRMIEVVVNGENTHTLCTNEHTHTVLTNFLLQAIKTVCMEAILIVIILIMMFLILFPLLVLPTIRARQTEINATAEVGNSAMLACDADGFPEPIVTWIQYVVT